MRKSKGIGKMDRSNNSKKLRTGNFAEKKRAQNWLKRQFSRQMSGDLDSNYQQERVTAVAATAYAIKSLEESPIPDQRRTSSGLLQSPMSRLKSKKEDKMPEQKKDSGGGPEPSLSRVKSKKEGTPPEPDKSLSRLKSKNNDTAPEPGKVSKRFSGKYIPVSTCSSMNSDD